MIVTKGIEVRLYPTKAQANMINKNIGAARVAYNAMLYRKQKHYEETKESLNVKPTDLYEEFPWMKEVDSRAITSAYMDLNAAYNNWFNSLKRKTKQNSKAPKFKKKSHNGSYRNTSICECKKLFRNGKIFIPLLKLVTFRNDNIDITKIKKIRNLTIKRTNTNKYFCSICCDYEVPNFVKTGKSIGLDLGVRNHIIPSYGKPYENKHFLKNSEKKIKHLQRNLSRKQKGSKNYEKARLKLAIAHEKLSNRRKDYIQQITTKIVKENDIICIEDLAVSNMLKNHQRAKGIADVSFYTVRSMLDYKCRWYGKQLVVINRWYPSSKTCGNCGYIYKELGDKDHWTCPSCGTHHDRDLNAARNILSKGLKSIKLLYLNKQIPLERREFKPCGERNSDLATNLSCSMKQENRKFVKNC
jgi:putative transposase